MNILIALLWGIGITIGFYCCMILLLLFAKYCNTHPTRGLILGLSFCALTIGLWIYFTQE